HPRAAGSSRARWLAKLVTATLPVASALRSRQTQDRPHGPYSLHRSHIDGRRRRLANSTVPKLALAEQRDRVRDLAGYRTDVRDPAISRTTDERELRAARSRILDGKSLGRWARRASGGLSARNVLCARKSIFWRASCRHHIAFGFVRACCSVLPRSVAAGRRIRRRLRMRRRR